MYELDLYILWRYTGYANKNFLYVKAFESYHLTDKQTQPKHTTPLRGWSKSFPKLAMANSARSERSHFFARNYGPLSPRCET